MIVTITKLIEQINDNIEQTQFLLEDDEMQDITFKERDDALIILEAYTPSIIKVVREINRTALDIKKAEYEADKMYAEKGVKTIKEREARVRQDFLEIKRLMQDWKELRDNLQMKQKLLEYMIEQ